MSDEPTCCAGSDGNHSDYCPRHAAQAESELAPARGSASGRDIAYNLLHPGFQRTYWVNLYPNGQMTSTLCATEQEALNRCTYTGETPNAMQVEIRIVPLTPNRQALRHGGGQPEGHKCQK